MHKFVLYVIILFLFTLCKPIEYSEYVEDNCKVRVPALQGEYEGWCYDGYAHWWGTAKGEDDTYDGRFKNGMPHGRGEYTWGDKAKYRGRWREGERDGRGIYVSIENDEKIREEGVWEADTLLREKGDRDYEVGHVLNLNRYNIRKVADEHDRIMVRIRQRGRQNTNIRNFFFTIPGEGDTYRTSDQTGYQNVDFPADCEITYETIGVLRQVSYRVRFEVTINEPGEWLITLYN